MTIPAHKHEGKLTAKSCCCLRLALGVDMADSGLPAERGSLGPVAPSASVESRERTRWRGVPWRDRGGGTSWLPEPCAAGTGVPLFECSSSS